MNKLVIGEYRALAAGYMVCPRIPEWASVGVGVEAEVAAADEDT